MQSAAAALFRRRRIARRAAAAALAAAALGLAAAFGAGSRTMRLLDRADAGLHARLRARLESVHGLVLYAPLDAGIPLNRATGMPLAGVGTRVVPGRRAEARRFDGRKGQSLGTDVLWSRFARRGGTVFLWLDLADTGREQRIVWDRGAGEAAVGLRLLPDRTLEAVFADADGLRTLAAPLPPAGRFVPVGFAFGPDRAALWIDGREAAAAPVRAPLRLPHHAFSFSPSRLHPLVGAADEATAWDRPLADAELRALSRTRRAADERLEPWRTRRAAAVGALSRTFRVAARVLDRLVPFRGGPASLRAEIPELDIVFSKADERHFAAAHEASLRAGWRTRAAARDRDALVRWRGRDAVVPVSLDDAYAAPSPQRPAAPRRPSLLLRGAPGFFAPGSGLARLVPPERFGALHPDAPAPLPGRPDRLVRLVVEGRFVGFYELEPFDEAGGAWRALGEKLGLRPDHLFVDSLPAAGASGGGWSADPAAAAAARRATRSLLLSDPHFPWSGAEASWRAKDHARRRAELAFGAPRLQAIDLMGDNPSPFYVTNAVDLRAAGPGVSWRSRDPATLDVDGTVHNGTDEPRVVALDGTFPDGTTRTFRFRVMPREPRLPALFLHVADPVRKDRRTDFSCVRIPAGGGPPEALFGTAATGGGVRHRGNTSYVRGSRRSLSLEFDRPVDWTGAPAPATHLLLLSGYADATRLRNALCFDAFAAMRAPGAPRGSVPVAWTDVFVNGEWAGVWECAPRLRDVAEAWADAIYKVRTPDGLWSRVSADMLDRRDPPPPGQDPYAPFLELARFVAEAPDAAFAAGAADRFDLDEVADMALLLEFTGNMDGRITNQYVVRRRSDGRWLALPWDYDKTFLADKTRTAHLSNPLYDRCRRLVPGFRDRMAARWAAHRAGPLSDEALLRWIDEKAAALAPFMDEDDRLLRPDAPPGRFAEAVSALRAEALFRARRLDERFAAARP